MTPEEALDKATEMLLSPDFAPVIEQALTNSKDVAVGAAILVYPIIYKLLLDTDIEEDELLGTGEGDGIAIYLLSEVFEVAAEAGLPGADSRDMAEKAVIMLGDMLADAKEKSGLAPPAGGADTQPMPAPPQGELPMGPPQGLLAGGA